MKAHPVWPFLVLVLLFTALSACGGDGASSPVVEASTKQGQGSRVAGGPARSSKAGSVADVPIESFRRDLLYVAFRAASAMPISPLARDRARAQERVAMTCFRLDQPELALEFGGRIGDWRRGAVIADYAHYCALHGDLSQVEHYLGLADQIAKDAVDPENPQLWQRDTIWMKIGRTYALMNRPEAAAKFAGGTDPISGTAFDAGWARTTSDRAELMTVEQALGELRRLEDVLVEDGSGIAYSALVTCGRVYERFFENLEMREQAARRIDLARQQSKLPPDLRLSTMLHCAKVALDRADRATAIDWYRKSAAFLEEVGREWTAEGRIAFAPQLASVRFHAGEEDEARVDLDEALAVYHRERITFRSTQRADILRPFAEAYHAIGDDERAGALYEIVIEEGLENPNSRPRADDITATCISMAEHGFEPSQKLLARINEVVGGLGDPW
jgi:tetratricopeptide (TPR) repeat protein